MIDYSALLYDPIYAVLGVEATLTTATATVDLTVIDETRPKTRTEGGVETSSVGPGAFARIPELVAKGIARSDWIGSTLTFNGRSWIVREAPVQGSPNGEDLGEVRFLLRQVIAENGGGVGPEAPPAGSAYLVNDGDAYFVTADGSYLLAKV